ncbi:MAG: aldehyde dehydrogenase family protein [Mycoplasmatales bacterium]|nr:aldehyde dehydrogenase family protein [Mycoplasmatales bacterium]
MRIKAYIDGKFIETENTYEIYNPQGGIVGFAPSLKSDDIERAYQAARKSQKEWELQSVDYRIKIMEKFADELEKRADSIAEVMVKEIAKGFKSAKSEVIRTAELFRDVNKEYKKIYKSEMNFPKLNKKVEILRKPLGVVAAISPFNYPINLSGSKIAPALVSGNSVVLKAATNGTLSAAVFAEIAHDIGIPKGVFNYVTGRGRDIGSLLYSNEEINAISFTGGERVGIEISKNVSMANQIFELGGKDVAIVLPDADIELSANEIVKGAFSYSGQRCTAIKRAFVQKENKKDLIKRIVELVNDLSVGKPEDDAFITHVINDGSRKFIMELVQDALDKGAVAETEIKVEGNLISPIVLSGVTPEMRIAWEEQFGPVLPILEVSSNDQAIELANRSEYGLQSSIFTKNIDLAIEMANKLEVGSLNINGSSQRGPDLLPFTGVKKSGLNVQGVKYSIETMTRTFNVVNNIKK